MSADVEAWKDSVRREAARLRLALISNSERLAPEAVQFAEVHIALALKAVGVEEIMGFIYMTPYRSSESSLLPQGS